jgi:hypothetical protein
MCVSLFLFGERLTEKNKICVYKLLMYEFHLLLKDFKCFKIYIYDLYTHMK